MEPEGSLSRSQQPATGSYPEQMNPAHALPTCFLCAWAQWLHSEEPHNLCHSSNIIMVIISRKMRWSRHVACVREMRNVY